MENTKPRIGKKGGAKRVAQELTKIRNVPLSKKIQDIVDKAFENPEKKSAKLPARSGCLMSVIRKYSDFVTTLGERNELKLGIVADSNVLISATYESDGSHDQTVEFFDLFGTADPSFLQCECAGGVSGNSSAEFLRKRLWILQPLVGQNCQMRSPKDFILSSPGQRQRIRLDRLR